MLGQVVTSLENTQVGEIVVVTGANRESLETLLAGKPVRFEHNPDYANGEMLASVKVGLSSLDKKSQAAMIVMGDQPQIQRQVIERVIDAYQTNRSPIIVPSYNMRRGHPWLVDRLLWTRILTISAPATLRDFLEEQQGRIEYLTVEDDSILRDLDTPQDYLRELPAS